MPPKSFSPGSLVRSSCPCILCLLFAESCTSSKFSIVNQINIFKVPEAPKEIVPEEKVSVPVPEEPEAPPVQGTRLLY